MIRVLLCTALAVSSFGAFANDWQQDFFSPMTNELPSARGVAVDDLGYVHLQAFNRFAGGSEYALAHQYTIGAQGQIPWMWGLTQADRRSDCGVYAKSGQRLDCTRIAGWYGDETRLEMRSRYGSYPIWQTRLPQETQLLDASIPSENEALFVARIDGPTSVELGVFRAYGNGPAEVLSVVPACPMGGQAPTLTRLRMPEAPGQSIHFLKACQSALGSIDLIAEDFDPIGGQWTTQALLPLPYGANLTHAAINADGKRFALVDDSNTDRQLLASGIDGAAWIAMPIPPGDIAGFVVNERALAIPMQGAAPDRTDVESMIWFDLQGGFWPQFVPTPALASYDAQAFALSNQNAPNQDALIVLGNDGTQASASPQLWTIDRYGQDRHVAALPLSSDEVAIETPYLLAGPNNTAIVGRTIARDLGYGSPEIGVRVNRYDLPF